MRTSFVFAAVVLAGCAVQEERREVEVRDVVLSDAGYSASRAPAAVDASIGAPEVAPWLDPVAAQLVRAAVSAHDKRRRVVLENLANVNTPGYKRRVVRTTVQQVVGSDGESFSIPVVTGTVPVFTMGTLEITERSLDVAIDGDGFFAVILLDGSWGYTRDGGFHVNADGKFVTGEGHVLLPEITIPPDTLEISIEPQGRVSGRTAGSPDTATVFGQLQLHRFVNPCGLIAEGAIWRTSESSGRPTTGTPGTTGLGCLKQGFLERSNIESQNELIDLQILERQHQTLVRVLAQFGMLAP